MKSAVFPTPMLFALLLGTTAVPGCVSKSNPVLPSTGGSNPIGLVEGEGSDGGASGDTLKADVAQADVLSNADSGVCDLVRQSGCPQYQACYPVDGVGRCQEYGYVPTNSPCAPSLGPQFQCMAGLACAATTASGAVCAPLCDVLNPPKGCLPACQLLPGFTSVGYCPP